MAADSRLGGSDRERPVAEPESSSTDEVVAVSARAHRPRRDVGSWCQHVRHQLNIVCIANLLFVYWRNCLLF